MGERESTLRTRCGESTRHLALQRGSLRSAPCLSSSVAKPPSMTTQPPHFPMKSDIKVDDVVVVVVVVVSTMFPEPMLFVITRWCLFFFRGCLCNFKCKTWKCVRKIETEAQFYRVLESRNQLNRRWLLSNLLTQKTTIYRGNTTSKVTNMPPTPIMFFVRPIIITIRRFGLIFPNSQRVLCLSLIIIPILFYMIYLH